LGEEQKQLMVVKMLYSRVHIEQHHEKSTGSANVSPTSQQAEPQPSQLP
jgi:hypothetical protein